MDWENYRKQCYFLARNEKQYLKDKTFDQKVQEVLTLIDMEEESQKNKALNYLEEMITFGPAYGKAEEEFSPVLIYKSESICYGVLNYFADKMAEGLQELGIPVEIFDCRERPLEDLIPLSEMTYRAVLGIQTYFYSIQLQNGECLHDRFAAPKYIMQFDHPIAMHNHWMKAPKDLTVLIHDRNYQNFLQKYYGNRLKTVLFAPGGEECSKQLEKKYDLSFVGTYHSIEEPMESARLLNRMYQGLGRRLLKRMKHHPNETYEASFEAVCQEMGCRFQGEEQLQLLFEAKQAYYVVMFYYRQKVLQSLLDSGVEIHVFGDSWKQKIWSGYSNLILHPEVTVEESLEIYAQSKISLNIMSWHKDGMTERIANAMLNHSLVVSDQSTYLQETYGNNQEMILFDLENYANLSDRIQKVLQDEERRKDMVQRAYVHAKEKDTWVQKAKEFMQVVEQQRGENA